MASKFETSFGARLRKFEDAIAFIQNWQDYTPDRPEIELANLTAFIAAIKTANTSETETEATYKAAVANRSELFNKNPRSVEKLITPIKAAVSYKFGRNSENTKNVAGIIRSFRASKLIKLPADPANPDKKNSVSQSQRSYGSRTQFFADMVDTISTYPGYTSSNPLLTLDALQQKKQELTTANDAVASNLEKISASRLSRIQAYDKMKALADTLKDYAIAHYGNSSREYKSLTGLGI